MVHATPPTPPQPKPPWCPWRIETSVGWWLKNSPSHWKNMRRIVKLHENRNPKRSGWKFHQKILELPDTYAIALTLPVVKTKAVLDTAFERPKRPNGSLSAWVQLMLPCVMTSMSGNLAGPILQWGPVSTHLENSDSKNPPPTTLATHPPDFDKLQPFQRIFTSSEAQTARKTRCQKSWIPNPWIHGSSPSELRRAAPVQLKVGDKSTVDVGCSWDGWPNAEAWRKNSLNKKNQISAFRKFGASNFLFRCPQKKRLQRPLGAAFSRCIRSLNRSKGPTLPGVYSGMPFTVDSNRGDWTCIWYVGPTSLSRCEVSGFFGASELQSFSSWVAPTYQTDGGGERHLKFWRHWSIMWSSNVFTVPKSPLEASPSVPSNMDH